MPANFLSRIRKDLAINLHGLREVILALSERVNRKVQVMKLHWQAAQLSDQIDAVYQQLGAELATLLGSGERRPASTLPSQNALLALTRATGQLRGLRGDLLRVDGLVGELEAETLRDDLLKLQQDLGTRGLGLERLIVATETPALGRSLKELGISATCRVVTVLRGTTQLDRPEDLPLRGGDIVLLLGRTADLSVARTLLHPPMS
jgi:TrkA-C domain